MKKNVEIKKVFLKLVDTKPFESINVSLICEELNMKRQSFYYHYRDIYDLVESILSDYTDELITSDLTRYYLNRICDFVYSNLYFFSQCINGGLKEAVNKFFVNLFLPYVTNTLANVESSKNLAYKDIMEIATYHSEALSFYALETFRYDKELNLDHIVNRIEIFLDKENLERTAKLFYEKRREI